MKNWLEKQFRLSEFNTDIKTELLAGLTTFVTMAYVLATIPNILAGAGYDKHTTLTVMILLIMLCLKERTENEQENSRKTEGRVYDGEKTAA